VTDGTTAQLAGSLDEIVENVPQGSLRSSGDCRPRPRRQVDACGRVALGLLMEGDGPSCTDNP